MKHGLPKIGRGAWGVPVTEVRPDWDKLSVLPLKSILTPFLGAVVMHVVSAALKFHEYIVAVYQGRLVVSQQIAAIGGLLVRHKRVIHDVGEDAIRVLAYHTDGPSVPWVLRPLGPNRRLRECHSYQ